MGPVSTPLTPQPYPAGRAPPLEDTLTLSPGTPRRRQSRADARRPVREGEQPAHRITISRPTLPVTQDSRRSRDDPRSRSATFACETIADRRRCAGGITSPASPTDRGLGPVVEGRLRFGRAGSRSPGSSRPSSRSAPSTSSHCSRAARRGATPTLVRAAARHLVTIGTCPHRRAGGWGPGIGTRLGDDRYGGPSRTVARARSPAAHGAGDPPPLAARCDHLADPPLAPTHRPIRRLGSPSPPPLHALPHAPHKLRLVDALATAR